LRIGLEAHALLVMPPVTHLKLEALEQIERFVAAGGRGLGSVFLPDRAFGRDDVVDVSERVAALFGVDPRETQREFGDEKKIRVDVREHDGGGRVGFVRADAIARRVPRKRRKELAPRQRQLEPGQHEVPPDRHDPDPTSAGAALVTERGDYFEPSRHWIVEPDGERLEITAEVAAEREEVAEVVADAVARLIEPDVELANDELLCLHRVKDGRDLYFVVNPTGEPQEGEIAVAGDVQPVLWDPSTGEERPAVPASYVDGRTRFRLALPPVGSVFVLTEPARPWRVVDANGVLVTAVEDGRVRARGGGGEATITIERDGRTDVVAATAALPSEPIVLDGEWDFVAEDGNALAIADVLATVEEEGSDPERYAAVDAEEREWLPLVPGAWEFQQPAEPAEPYPFAVWYRAKFEANHVPSRLQLIVDGFAGADRRVYVNGAEVTAASTRSDLDSQMRSLDVTSHVRSGANVIAIRLTLTRSTDGLLDLVKLIGDFSIEDDATLAPPRQTLRAADWTSQGHPYYSGTGVYRRRFDLTPEAAYAGLVLEADAGDDALEVVVNGTSAGVRLWPPYSVDVGALVRPGENELELRVANTPVNLLEAQARRSGLAAPPRLVPYAAYEFVVPS
ncbi:MAG: hypothetical protein KY396_02555, partial [Actinobacteria bacterium]|nr:hypothetical protein [Actinomycetota bacterium]